MGTIRIPYIDRHVYLGWIWARDGIVVPEREIVHMPRQLPGHDVDILLVRNDFLRTLKATFGMYDKQVEPSAAVNYEKHTTDAATQGSVPRSKFAM